MVQYGVWEPMVVKMQTYKTAVEVHKSFLLYQKEGMKKLKFR